MQVLSCAAQACHLPEGGGLTSQSQIYVALPTLPTRPITIILRRTEIRGIGMNLYVVALVNATESIQFHTAGKIYCLDEKNINLSSRTVLSGVNSLGI